VSGVDEIMFAPMVDPNVEACGKDVRACAGEAGHMSTGGDVDVPGAADGVDGVGHASVCCGESASFDARDPGMGHTSTVRAPAVKSGIEDDVDAGAEGKVGANAGIRSGTDAGGSSLIVVPVSSLLLAVVICCWT
jgi:hypothetical protein